jgi:hypothetical protein
LLIFQCQAASWLLRPLEANDPQAGPAPPPGSYAG